MNIEQASIIISHMHNDKRLSTNQIARIIGIADAFIDKLIARRQNVPEWALDRVKEYDERQQKELEFRI